MLRHTIPHTKKANGDRLCNSNFLHCLTLYNRSLFLSVGQGLPDRSAHTLSNAELWACSLGSVFSPLCFLHEQCGTSLFLSVVYYGIQVLTIPTFSVSAVSRKEESRVLQLLSKGLKWLIEINLKWHCGAQQFRMAVFIYLTILHASCIKRLPWEMILVYWLLF